ncbi:MAG: regulatory iron-sulfur-containing complex subunit RicT [Bacilli bacterium]|jgi:cell fate regulator YaaT (PSP1 superfamily)|nr:regulatory iron-sulfur-containing complex subunit RicT [Bacilli bacterium]NLB40277.1 stage 0 sporulation protein [Erysipelotrichaceae bacterium]MDD4303386.1 regulatory iron-sulfur-containing complex subunit RicT [Bacilli bacterium]HNY74154.1 regulatory iron-sulfur-containing complex subunit RicT [Bacilli bacterium]HPM07610.1 regulatory iron-sulfur-containing complex subunit RicT [Bacilli bacterium]
MPATINNYFIGVRFYSSSKAYYFGTENNDIKLGDHVVVESVRGLEIAKVVIEPQDIAKYSSGLELKPIERKANETDLYVFEENKKRAAEALKYCLQEIQNLNLDMHPLDAEYTLDGTKITITYVAEERVDFRELLKILAGRLRCRIELRQIGSRDKAKMVGGIGICGLPLCCSTFLHSFDGISISRAKNQMLSLNIPKISGHCGKLICCLLYEDEQYSELKKDFPAVGERFTIDGLSYRIGSYNVLSRMVRVESSEDVKFLPLEDVKKYMRSKDKK